ncbi:MAG: hypothetical protein U0575_06685 [Phycisphaerales bacterium]
MAQRIKSEFDARAQQVAQAEEARAKEARVREQRMTKFNEVCVELHALIQPRIDTFAKAFGEQVRIVPTITPAERSVTVAFLTDLADVTLTVRMFPDRDITGLVLEYDLLIIPIYFDYERHARLEMPLDKIDGDAIAGWLDDRIVSCVKSYLAMQDNEHYRRCRR